MIPLDVTNDDRASAMIQVSRDIHAAVVPFAHDLQVANQVHDLIVAGSEYVRKGRLTAWEVVETISAIDKRWGFLVCSLILDELDDEPMSHRGWTVAGLARSYGVMA
jgi:hypothetical protein